MVVSYNNQFNADNFNECRDLFLVEQSSLRLLLVDDHPLFLDGLELVLENAFESVNITAASTIDEAIHALQSGQDFDLITLDWSLPMLREQEPVEIYPERAPVHSCIGGFCNRKPNGSASGHMNSGASFVRQIALGRKALLETDRASASGAARQWRRWKPPVLRRACQLDCSAGGCA